MIWVKTDAGRAEMQTRSLVKDRAQRNLLLVIDGKKPAERLLADMAGISAADFATLEGLGLIAQVAPPPPPPPKPAAESASGGVDIDVNIDLNAFDYATLRAAIGRLISKELGMRGFAMSMILEESMTVEDLKDVAQRTLRMIAERKGIATAHEASKLLFGK
ncbi:MAG: hypothetical protein ABIQ33_11370 [Caldimonas sp.]